MILNLSGLFVLEGHKLSVKVEIIIHYIRWWDSVLLVREYALFSKMQSQRSRLPRIRYWSPNKMQQLEPSIHEQTYLEHNIDASYLLPKRPPLPCAIYRSDH